MDEGETLSFIINCIILAEVIIEKHEHSVGGFSVLIQTPGFRGALNSIFQHAYGLKAGGIVAFWFRPRALGVRPIGFPIRLWFEGRRVSGFFDVQESNPDMNIMCFLLL